MRGQRASAPAAPRTSRQQRLPHCAAEVTNLYCGFQRASSPPANAGTLQAAGKFMLPCAPPANTQCRTNFFARRSFAARATRPAPPRLNSPLVAGHHPQLQPLRHPATAAPPTPPAFRSQNMPSKDSRRLAPPSPASHPRKTYPAARAASNAHPAHQTSRRPRC